MTTTPPTPEQAAHDAGMSDMLDTLAAADRAAADAGLESRLIDASVGALAGTPAVRLVRAPAPRRVPSAARWGLAAAAALVVAVTLTIQLAAPTRPAPNALAAAELEAELDDEVAVLLATFDTLDIGLAGDVDLALADLVGVERSLSAEWSPADYDTAWPLDPSPPQENL